MNRYNYVRRRGLNALIFSAVCNSVRRKIFIDSISVIRSSELSLVRIDVDAISIIAINGEKSMGEVDRIFNSDPILTYKLEMKNIFRICSYKKRSYSIESKDETIIKSCGLSITLKQRDKIDLSRKLDEFKKNIHNFPLAKKYQPSIIPCCITAQEQIIQINRQFNCHVLFSRAYGTRMNVD